jgi:hypothetical protein
VLTPNQRTWLSVGSMAVVFTVGMFLVLAVD